MVSLLEYRRDPIRSIVTMVIKIPVVSIDRVDRRVNCSCNWLEMSCFVL